VWAADVTQFRTGEGWLHLAGVIDLWSRRVVGWSMSTTPNSELVTDALVMAFERGRPDRRVVHHSDRGAAYTSLAFSQRVAALELDQSFGSTGDCYDNAVVEAFWATLKRELAWIHNTTSWANRAALRAVRLHRRLLQPEPNPTPARPPKPRQLRTTLNRLKSRVHASGSTPAWNTRP
jgi:putative transposase